MPRGFIVENVNGMVFGENRDLLKNQLTRYRSAGYRVKWAVLNAKDYGVAQNRRRVLLVGVRSDQTFEYQFPGPTHGPGTRKEYVSQRDVMDRFPRWPEGEFNTEPFHWYYLSRKRRYPWGQPSPCVVGHWRHVPLHPSSPPLRRIDTDHWEFTRTATARHGFHTGSVQHCRASHDPGAGSGAPSETGFKWSLTRCRRRCLELW